MSFELLQMSTQEFLTFINKYPQFGSIEILNDEQLESSEIDHMPGDVVIFYDYCTDEATREESHELCEWLFGHHDRGILDIIHDFMVKDGYSEIDENDGSGGGLYYGTVHYRKN